jgi:RHH-type proline utilization regulon transcriptional repressor/proline dehydrogenase/delta 1-pyrroline-5-carboxylate dehydrogenase
MGQSADEQDEQDEQDAVAAVALAVELMDAAHEAERRPARRRARRLARLVDDPASMAFSMALTDQVARIADPARAVERLRSLLAETGSPRFLGPIDRVLLRGAAVVGPVAPRVVAAGLQWRLRRESAAIVLDADDPGFARHVAKRRREGFRMNVNVLGEAILGDDEAGRRRVDVLARIDRPDVDYVSVKISSVCARLSSLAFEDTVDRVVEQLLPLYRRALRAQPRVFVNLDMEEYRDLALTLSAFERILATPELDDADVGIVLQAYLPESHAALEQIARWADERRGRGGGVVKVRIVKGANLAMERVDAELHGWPAAPYPTKEDVDASYKRLLDRALDPRRCAGLRVGLASHNTFDVAWGIVRARRLGATDRLDIEMLEGMAPGESAAVLERVGRLTLYAPVVRRASFDAAIAYLVRRLDENTGPGNFLRDQLSIRPGSAAFVDQRDRFLHAVEARHHVDVSPRRGQDRAIEQRRFSIDDSFVNEPDTDWSLAANRAWLADLRRPGEVVIPPEIPIVVGEERIWPGPATGVGLDPSAPAVASYRYALADRALVDRAVASASAAQVEWSTRSGRERAVILERVAEALAARRGAAIVTMVRDAGKVVAEADVEVSEAIDMARRYARDAIALDDVDAAHQPIGPVVVAPPWNFPLAIPAGGVLAAIAAGNAAILKPARETVATAWLLAECLWEAGVPPDLVPFLPCPDDDVGRRLITHDGVGAVILTGALATAQLFLSWRPDLRLHAETSGKNAIVVTAAADLDLAVQDLVRSAFGHAGQKCSAASLAIVERSVLDDGAFLAKLADATRTLRVGPAGDLVTDVGPLIRAPEGPLRRALEHLDPGEAWLVRPEQRDDAGLLWSPGVKVGVRPGSAFHRTECFGPVLGVMAARDLDHAIELQNDTDFGLTGGIHSLDPSEVQRWVEGVAVGNAYVNRTTTGAIVGRQPFGGWKRSAVGPSVKAGGSAYVASLCTWSDTPDEASPARAGADRAGRRVDRARRSYPEAWSALSRPSDPTGLVAERNELRSVALTTVLLRIEADADPDDVEMCTLASATTGVRLLVSRAADEPTDAVAHRLATEPVDRVRVLGTVPEALWSIAADAWVHLDDRTPVADGQIELRRWSHEQAISRTAHRHGRPATEHAPTPPIGQR